MVRNQRKMRKYTYVHTHVRSRYKKAPFSSKTFKSLSMNLSQWDRVYDYVIIRYSWNIILAVVIFPVVNFSAIICRRAKSHHHTQIYKTHSVRNNNKNLKTELIIMLEEKMMIALIRRALDHCCKINSGFRVWLTGVYCAFPKVQGLQCHATVKRYGIRNRLSSLTDLESCSEENPRRTREEAVSDDVRK